MTLLTRIAVSNGDAVRKASANLVIAFMERRVVGLWNQELEREIQKRGSLTGPGPVALSTSNVSLTAREREILQLVAAGYTNLQVARRLAISQHTVKVHLRHIFDKLKVESRTQAAMYALRQGLVSVSQA